MFEAHSEADYLHYLEDSHKGTLVMTVIKNPNLGFLSRISLKDYLEDILRHPLRLFKGGRGGFKSTL